MNSPFVDEYAEDCDKLGDGPPKQRIDFAKYGKRVEGKKEGKKRKKGEKEGKKGEEETGPTDSLPPGIYCDIVNNLTQKWVHNLS